MLKLALFQFTVYHPIVIIGNAPGWGGNILRNCSEMENQLSRPCSSSFLKFFFSHRAIYHIHFSCNKFPIFDLKIFYMFFWLRIFWKYTIFVKFFVSYFWFKNLLFHMYKIFSKFYILFLSVKSFFKFIGRPTLALLYIRY